MPLWNDGTESRLEDFLLMHHGGAKMIDDIGGVDFAAQKQIFDVLIEILCPFHAL